MPDTTTRWTAAGPRRMLTTTLTESTPPHLDLAESCSAWSQAYEAIHAAWPDSTKYTENYRRLSRELQELDRRTAGKIARSGVKAFIIYHPALTYYARDYGIRQEAVETDRKEPSAKRLAELIRIARREGIRQIFYQKQFPASVVGRSPATWTPGPLPSIRCARR